MRTNQADMHAPCCEDRWAHYQMADLDDSQQVSLQGDSRTDCSYPIKEDLECTEL